MTDKLKAKLAAWVSAASGLIAYLVSLPPSNQDAVLGPIVALAPVDWRPEIGLITRGLAAASLIYAAHKHASQPPTPPAP